MSISSNLGRRLRALFRAPPPEPEAAPGEMPFDPEWEELLVWADVLGTRDTRGGGNVDAEEKEWAERIRAARERHRMRSATTALRTPGVSAEDAEWAAAIARAKSSQDGKRGGLSSRTRHRLERLIKRAAAATGSPPAASDGPSVPGSEEAEWRAAIERAKSGRA
jgi:hypothetical protein